MAPKVDRDRANRALKALKDQLGFSRNQTAPVLKRLLKVYDDNWEHIEADGYALLVDAILDNQDTPEGKGTEHVASDDSTGPCRKRLRSKEDEPNASCQMAQQQERFGSVSPQPDIKGKRIACIEPLTYQRNRKLTYDKTDNCNSVKQVTTSAPALDPPRYEVVKDVVTEFMLQGGIGARNLPDFEVPLAMIAPPCQIAPVITQDSTGQISTAAAKVLGNVHTGKSVEDQTNTSCKKFANSELASVEDNSSSNIEIATSETCEVKVSLSISSGRPNFRMPNLESIFKMVEDKCLREYKILNPAFSLMEIMKEICQSASELGSKSCQEEQENFVNVVPSIDSLKDPSLGGVFHGTRSCFPSVSQEENGDCLHRHMENGVSNQMPSNSSRPSLANSKNLDVQQNQLVLSCKPLHDVNDLSRGEERIRIPVKTDVNEEKCPSSFYYISNSIVYQNAHVNFSLARVGDEDCCADCFGDCLAAPIPCACARETGGEYAYTVDGIVKKEFLDQCISRNLNPQKDHFFYCEDCPLERSKNERSPDPCKGHLIQKFIKECWSKCGCSKHCGNRIVQRGLACSLQVFYTPGGKGWGLRTLEELPKGCFVCEFVGEVLTIRELHDRTVKTTGTAKQIHPVILDAGWGSGFVKDEETLCLDATFYGNVARFANHRCYDANMILIPVEIETPDHHYYHLAFFTARKVEAYEELTWDYGIDFDDTNPLNRFKCRCYSKYCRDMKRTKSRSRA